MRPWIPSSRFQFFLSYSPAPSYILYLTVDFFQKEIYETGVCYQEECEASQKTDPLAVFSAFTCIAPPSKPTRYRPTMIAENRWSYFTVNETAKK